MQTYTVSTRQEARTKLEEVTNGRRYTLGTGYDYELPYAVFYLPYGNGYDVWATQAGKVKNRIAIVRIGG